MGVHDAAEARRRAFREAWESQDRAALTLRYEEIGNPLDVSIDQVRAAKAGVDVAMMRLNEVKALREQDRRMQLTATKESIGVAHDKAVREAEVELDLCRGIYEDVLRCYLEGQRIRDAKKADRFNWLVGIFVIISGLGTVAQAIAAWK